MAVGGVSTNIVQRNGKQIILLGTLQNALREWATEHLWKQREDIEMEWLGEQFVIFGRRSVVERSRVIHQLAIYWVTGLYRVMNAVDLFYRALAVHRRVGFYRRFRRGRRSNWLPSVRRLLRQFERYVDDLIIAQGISVEKLPQDFDELITAQRGLPFRVQLGLASLLVLGMWFYWPAYASAPIIMRAALPVVTQLPETVAAPAEGTDVIGPSVAESDTASRPDLKALIAKVNANSQNDGLEIPITPSRSILSLEGISSFFGDSTPELTETTADGEMSAWTDPAGAFLKLGEGVASAWAHATQPRPISQDDIDLESLVITPPTEEHVSPEVAIVVHSHPPSGQASTVTTVQPPTTFPYELTLGPVWDTFIPTAPAEADHYWLESPFQASYNRFYSPSYQFGSTAGGRYRPHHGVDISNPTGTPVLAMAAGEIIHAGPDNPALLGPYNNFYGNSVVILLDRKLSTPQGEQDVYLLYGHMSDVSVSHGNRVEVGDVVGSVGMTGIAIGPHLHIEMRIGQNSYTTSVNPALWMRPLPGTGTVAVRLLNAEGRSWVGAKLSLLRFEGNSTKWVQTLETYRGEERLAGDPTWGENGALSNLPAGNYYITGEINGEKVGQNITIRAGETTFVELRTKQ